MQGTTRRGSELCEHRVDQGSAAAAMGCDGCGGSGRGLLWGWRHCWVRAWGTRKHGKAQELSSGCGCREPGHGKGEAHDVGMAHGRGAGQRRVQSRGEPGGKNERNENEAPPSFFIEPLGSRRVQGQLKS